MSKIKCPVCGAEIDENEKFCSECGAPVELPAVSVNTEPAAPRNDNMDLGTGANNIMGDVVGRQIDNNGIYNANQSTDNSVSHTDNSSRISTTNTTTTNYNQTIVDDTKTTVTCAISGRKILLTNSIVCPKCNRIVSSAYYDEKKLRCQACEKQAREEYKDFYQTLLAGSKLVSGEKRKALENKAAALMLDKSQTEEIELVIRETQGKELDAHLSELKQKEFDRTINLLLSGKADIKSCLTKIETFTKTCCDPQILYWYYLLCASVRPEQYIQDIKKAEVDVYWQQYWAFLAAQNIKDAEALSFIDDLKDKYPENNNDAILAQSILELRSFFETNDESYLQDAASDMNMVFSVDSSILNDLKELMSELSANIPKIDLISAKNDFNRFVISQILKAEKNVKAALADRKAKLAAAARELDSITVKPVRTETAAPTKKGFVLDDRAVQPVTAPSFAADNNKDGSDKPKGGSASKVIIALVAGVAVCAALFVFLGKEEQQPEALAPVAVAEAPVQTPVGETPIAKSSTPEPVKNITRAETEKMKTAAAKAAAENVVLDTENEPAQDLYKQAVSLLEQNKTNEAIALLKKAGEAGNAHACMELYKIYTSGSGNVSKNTLQSKIWLKKAAALGLEDAKALVK